MSLLYGLVMLLLMGGVVWLGQYAEQKRLAWVRAIYDYSGVLLVAAPMLILIWHLYLMKEDRRGHLANPTPVVEGATKALVGTLPAGVVRAKD
jgi:hypothetical protein